MNPSKTGSKIKQVHRNLGLQVTTMAETTNTVMKRFSNTLEYQKLHFLPTGKIYGRQHSSITYNDDSDMMQPVRSEHVQCSER
jgi:hypothetical protein